MDYQLKDTISFADMYAAVENATQSCFGSDGEFYPVFEDVARKRAILMAYTDIEVSRDIDEASDFVYTNESALYKEVTSMVNQEQLHALDSAIEKAIQYKRDTYVESLRLDIEAAKAELVKAVSEMSKIITLAEELTGDDMKALMAQLRESAQHAQAVAKKDEQQG